LRLTFAPQAKYYGTMLLSDYLVKEEIGQAEFAEMLGVHASTVGRWISGERTPRGSQAKAIVEMTDQKVTLQDIYDTQ
jgi:predicted transcriptional regulator